MDKYICHKEVMAGKIAELVIGQVARYLILVDGIHIYPTESYFDRHNPQPGGYYVRYADDYESFSPVNVFEEGYTKVDEALAS